MSSFCYSHFFSKKFQHICVSLNVNFNESLTNDVVSFEQLGPVLILQAVYICGELYLALYIHKEFFFYLLQIQDFSEKVNFYVMGCVSFYKSSWSEIKSNAALFTGNS